MSPGVSEGSEKLGATSPTPTSGPEPEFEPGPTKRKRKTAVAVARLARPAARPAARSSPGSLIRRVKTAPVESGRAELDEPQSNLRWWLIFVWNDPINLMSFVTFVFHRLDSSGETPRDVASDASRVNAAPRNLLGAVTCDRSVRTRCSNGWLVRDQRA